MLKYIVRNYFHTEFENNYIRNNIRNYYKLQK